MRDIDFLPVQYRQRRVQRRSQPWRIIAVVTIGLLLGLAALVQHARKIRAERELAAITPGYQLAVRQDRKLAETRAAALAAREKAELYTYLRHSWPRSQLLAAAAAPLPEGVILDQLEITRTVPQAQRRPERYTRPRRNAQAEEHEETSKLSPHAGDLKRLRGEFDKAATLVVLSGVTGDSAALHRYLGELGRTSLFAMADLDSLEAVPGSTGGRLKFRATLRVVPGYGQPGGPDTPVPERNPR